MQSSNNYNKRPIISFENLLKQIENNEISAIDLRQYDFSILEQNLDALERALHINRSVVRITYPKLVLRQIEGLESKEEEIEEKEKEKEKEEVVHPLWLSVMKSVNRNARDLRFNVLLLRIEQNAVAKIDFVGENLEDLSLEQLYELAFIISQSKKIKEVVIPILTKKETNYEELIKTWGLIRRYAKMNQLEGQITEIQTQNVRNKQNYTLKRLKQSFIEPFKIASQMVQEVINSVTLLSAEVLGYISLLNPLYKVSNIIFGTSDSIKLADFTFDKNAKKLKFTKREYPVNAFTRYLAPVVHGVKMIGRLFGLIPAFTFAGAMLSVWPLLAPAMVLTKYTSLGKFQPKSTQSKEDELVLHKEWLQKNSNLLSQVLSYKLEKIKNALYEHDIALAEQILEDYKTSALEENIEVDEVCEKYEFQINYAKANAFYAEENYQEALKYFELANKYAEENGLEDEYNLPSMIELVRNNLEGKELLISLVKSNTADEFEPALPQAEFRVKQPQQQEEIDPVTETSKAEKEVPNAYDTLLVKQGIFARHHRLEDIAPKKAAAEKEEPEKRNSTQFTRSY